MTWLTVPVIDITAYWTGVDASKRDVARQIGEACRDIGFLVIAGHRVPPDLIAAVDDVSREFFDLPLDEKMKVVRPAPDVTRGYIPMEGESVARSRGEYAPGDLNESFMIGPVDAAETAYFHGPPAGKHFAPNLWPERPARLRAIYTPYYRVMADLGCTRRWSLRTSAVVSRWCSSTTRTTTPRSRVFRAARVLTARRSTRSSRRATIYAGSSSGLRHRRKRPPDLRRSASARPRECAGTARP